MDRIINGSLDDCGFAIIKIGILLPDKVNARFSKAIIDTGAHHSLLQKLIVDSLQLKVSRVSQINHPQYGIQDNNNYNIDLLVDTDNPVGPGLIEGWRVGTMNALDYPAAMIIGVDLLQHWKYTHDGPNRVFELTIPQ